MLTEESILAIISCLMLVISETLPFVSNTEGNGVLHSVLLVFMKLQKALKNEQEKQVVTPFVKQ